jgi:hypothetical protein
VDCTRVSRFLAAAVWSIAASITPRAFGADPERVEWSQDWPRVRLVEGLDIIALTVASYELNARWQPPVHSNWTRPILFDAWARQSRSDAKGAADRA